MAYLAELDQLPKQGVSFPFYRDEEEDYLTPPDLRSAGPPSDAFLSAPSTPDLFGTVVKDANPTNPPRVKAAYEGVQAVNAQRPERKPAGFWRTLAGIGAGLGAGYANANSAAKGLPHGNGVAGIMDAVTHPGYAGKMADWQQKQQDALQTLKAAEAADKGEQDYLSEPVKRDYLTAETAHMGANTDKIHHDIAEEKAHDRYLTLKDGSVYDTKNQSTIWKPQTPPDERLAFATQHGWDPKDPAIQGWIMDGKSPTDQKPDRIQLIQGDNGWFSYDTVTHKADPIKGPTKNSKPDPLADDRLRIQAQEDSQKRLFTHQDVKADQNEIDRLQGQEQKLHKLRGALGRELRKKDDEYVNDPVTGRPMLDGNKKPMRKKQVWSQLQDQYDQATTQVQDLQEQQKRLHRRNLPGGAPAPAGGGGSIREQLGFPPK